MNELPSITSITGRIIHNSRGSKTIEVDVMSDGTHLGRACAPSGASVGKYEAQSFPEGGPEKSLEILKANAGKFVGLDAGDLESVHAAVRAIDGSADYGMIGGSVAYAVTIAAADSAARARDMPLFRLLPGAGTFRFPYPLGNILGGGAHAGPGTPDIQEILIAATGAKSVREAVETNLAIHRELGRVILERDPGFSGGRGDEGGWAPETDNYGALEMATRACERLGYAPGREVSLGVDFAASTQWNGNTYDYKRGGFENDAGEQIEFASDIIKKYKLAYAEDAVHEEAFEQMSELARRFPGVMITGDDLTVTNAAILQRAIDCGSCNAAILKVNQAGSLQDAMEFARLADRNGISLITSHRSGESTDSQISHIGIATGSKLLKVGIVGGERVAKLNELLRLEEHGLICGMARIRDRT